MPPVKLRASTILSEYGKAHGNVKIDYQSVGSGAGINQLKQQTVDFGASDAPMKDEDLKAAPGAILHIPTVLGAWVGESLFKRRFKQMALRASVALIPALR